MENSAVNIRQVYNALLCRCYMPDELAFIQDFIRKYELQNFVEGTFTRIESLIDLGNAGMPVDFSEIKTISYQALKMFNIAIARVTSFDEKIKLKNLLSKFHRIIQSEISHISSRHEVEIKKAIDEGLEQALHTEQYDESDFRQYFPVSDINIRNEKITIEKNEVQPIYLLWNSGIADIDKCIELLTGDYSYIRSVNEFKKFFQDTSGHSFLKCNSSKIDNLLLLFNRLWKNNYIELKGGKGIWKHLNKRLRDYSNNPFTENFTKKISKLEKNIDQYPFVLNELNPIMERIKRRS